MKPRYARHVLASFLVMLAVVCVGWPAQAISAERTITVYKNPT